MQPVNPGQPDQSLPSQRERSDYDQALKRMLTRAHDAVLALLAPDLSWLGERSPELPSRPRRADLVWEVRSAQGNPRLLHIELQTEPDLIMGERIAEYMIQLVLEGRFGTLDPALLAAIDSADEATLREVGKHAATGSLDALRVQLSAQQDNQGQPGQQDQTP